MEQGVASTPKLGSNLSSTYSGLRETGVSISCSPLLGKSLSLLVVSVLHPPPVSEAGWLSWYDPESVVIRQEEEIHPVHPSSGLGFFRPCEGLMYGL
jgi:hypothetical protein